MKNMLHEAGVPWEFLSGSRKEEVVPVFGKTARQLMQTLGTEWGRDMVSSSLWVDLCRERDIKPAVESGLSVVVEGTRFQNEVQCVRDLGGIVVRVNRPGCGCDGHRSEILPEFDFEISNDGTKDDLCRKFDEFLNAGLGDKCIVHGCSNHTSQGRFAGVLCAPCHHYITTGKIGCTDSFLGKMRDAIETLKHHVA